jgi:hypothetical protein
VPPFLAPVTSYARQINVRGRSYPWMSYRGPRLYRALLSRRHTPRYYVPGVGSPPPPAPHSPRKHGPLDRRQALSAAYFGANLSALAVDLTGVSSLEPRTLGPDPDSSRLQFEALAPTLLRDHPGLTGAAAIRYYTCRAESFPKEDPYCFLAVNRPGPVHPHFIIKYSGAIPLPRAPVL